MGIAVACDGLAIAPAFVQCSSYMCYEVAEGQPIGCRNIPAFDQPPEKLPEFFDAIDADTVIVGCIDGDIAANLEAHDVKVVSDKLGDPLSAVREYLSD